jgi:pimeloyl-ACP methyl ester carboxylesterase
VGPNLLVRVYQRNAQIGATVMPTGGKYRGGVLVLPGGKPESTAKSHPLQLTNQRIEWLARSLRHRLGSGVLVRRVQYRVRGWNSAGLDALRDAATALDSMREHFDAAKIVVVGHSMGGRVAAHLSASGYVGAVVALAPWWPRDDADLIPNTCRLLVMHGTADTWTDPRSSYRQTVHARDRGVDAKWISIEGAGHYLFRQWPRWHGLTAQFAASQLSERLLEP